ncbi:MAG: hypothetical protein A2X81_13815 [Desulfobacterales bacterium GWB2_56_26]|nr:MAG: hypothetical protein A2X81_13815 [Desulfobacterales bacterium GWB2_56_26]
MSISPAPDKEYGNQIQRNSEKTEIAQHGPTAGRTFRGFGGKAAAVNIETTNLIEHQGSEKNNQ